MAQIVPIATLVGAGASLYATARQAQMQKSQAQQQVENAQAQNEARTQQTAAMVPDRRASRARWSAACCAAACWVRASFCAWAFSTCWCACDFCIWAWRAVA